MEGDTELSRSKSIEEQNNHTNTVQSVDDSFGNDRVEECTKGLLSFADRLDYALMLFGAIGSCIHGAALPVFLLLFGRLIDSLGSLAKHPHRLASEVSRHALHLVYLGLLVLISAWIGVAFWMHTGERQTARLRIKYIQSVLNQDMNFFSTDSTKQNVLQHISSDAILVQDAIGDKIGHCLRYISQFVVGFVVGFLLVWQLTLVTLAVVPLMAIAGGTYAVVTSNLSRKGEAAYAEAGKIAEEVISQVRTVYSNVGESKAIEAYSRSLRKVFKLGKKGGLVKGLGVGSTYGLLFCVWALLLWYAGVLVMHGVTNGGKAFSSILNVIFSGFALGQAAPNLSSLAKARAAARNIVTMIEKDKRSLLTEGEEIVRTNLVGEIKFCKVSFAYESRKIILFEDLDFTIDAGKTTAIVGQSGSGKSTIISLIERLYEPKSGRILLDRHDIKNLQLKWLRNQMGLVSQEPVLFSTSIVNNIMYGREGASMEDVIEASRVANAHSFIEELPDGYLTFVGDGGKQLSGGQKQRIAIARAILRNPAILLLDEATSALDAESEFIVQQALERVMVNRTTAIVAHRLSTISKADKIIVLKNGKVVECGSHSELMSKGEEGEYAMLVQLQVLGNNSNRSSACIKEILGISAISPLQHAREEKVKETMPAVSTNTKQGNHASPKEALTPIRKLIQLNRSEWSCAMLGSIGAIIAGAEGPLFALGITRVLSVFYTHNAHHIKNELRTISLIFIGAALITVPVYVLQHYYYTLIGEKLTNRVRRQMFSALLRNEIGWFDQDQNSPGSLTSSLAVDATLVRSIFSERMSTVIQNMSLAVTAFAISFFFSWRLALVVVSTFPVLIGASIAEHLFLTGFGGNYTSNYAQATAIAREAINNIRTVQALNAQQQITSHFCETLEKPNEAAFLRGHIAGMGYGLSQFFAYCSYALGLWYASVLIAHKQSDFGSIMKSFMVLIITAISVAETIALAPDIVKGSQALSSVFSILERKTELDPDEPGTMHVEAIEGDIEFRDVSFKYPTRPNVFVLQGLSFWISAGSSFALVGKSGSGKSSVIALVMRFYDRTSGDILIDGMDIRYLNLKSLRQRIGLVQQEPALFSTTIYENIAYGKEGATEIEVMKAAKAANIHGFISRLADGYNTPVGDCGAQLSGGQKQRVAIARAILKDPAILLLDEATSALDTASEKLVQQALNVLMEGRTTIVVAHRLSTIREADMIAVISEGRVQEAGRHEVLIKRQGSAYSRLLQLQQQNG
ncbi:ABC transporter B family member 13 [Rhynchospora pubera]|uniref:ABC transporter B family member 13 n=1 Tax=Rhynchospora pubera TaxID=906938 RepID=A0AAV8CUV5_9POAL|nr:ABC transporter B family member 13 [Rhynchospora pubera]